MINSGLSLLRALTILGEQTSNRRLGEVITLVRAGEIGGFLDQVLVKVAETFEKEVELQARSARP
jgi:type IV pilus assembly protein PilC